MWNIRTLDKHTIKGYKKHLRVLFNNVNLDDPEAVERFILKLSRKNKYKNNLLTAYAIYCKANEIKWSRPPPLRNEACPIKIPIEQNIDLVISCSTPTYAVAFSFSKYGLRPDEISKITLRDLDLSQRTLTVRTSKMGHSRTIPLDARTIDKVRDYIARKKITGIDLRLFASGEKISDKWMLFRKRALRARARQAQLFMQLYSKWQDKEFNKSKHFVMTYPIRSYEDYEGIFRDEEKGTTFRVVGTFFEGLGVLVKRGLVDKGFVDDMMSGDIIGFWEKYREVVFEERRRMNYPQALE
jgi:hypothetical protein